ncbi:NfeD family protein [Kineococcus sp. SYSU DK003]|uniref:NfeD family protein n=1 Tax=Kineococcus sp. SYSU DK003 TaxID=3383124 RepID=UPI003D7E0B44
MDFLEALLDRSWLLWLASALVLGILEITAIDLVFAMLAGGALAGALADALGLGFVGQVLVAAAVAGLLIGTIRPVLLRRLHMPPAGTTNAAALVGRPALVLAEVSARGGLVKLVGETWSARSAPGTSYTEGEDVVVLAIDGATAVVGQPVTPAQLPEERT